MQTYFLIEQLIMPYGWLLIVLSIEILHLLCVCYWKIEKISTRQRCEFIVPRWKKLFHFNKKNWKMMWFLLSCLNRIWMELFRFVECTLTSIENLASKFILVVLKRGSSRLNRSQRFFDISNLLFALAN